MNPGRWNATRTLKFKYFTEQPWMWSEEGTLKFIYFPHGGIVEFQDAEEVEAAHFVSRLHERRITGGCENHMFQIPKRHPHPTKANKSRACHLVIAGSWFPVSSNQYWRFDSSY